MKKLSKLCESLWADIQGQASGEEVKAEDRPWVSFEIDGSKYVLSKYVQDLEEKYLEENDGDEWNCFGFVKPRDGGVLHEVQFSYRDNDLEEDQYDVFVIRDFYDTSKDNWVLKRDYLYNLMVKSGYIESMPLPEIKKVLLDFTNKIFDDNRLSEYAEYQIFCMMGSDYGENYAIYVNTDSEYVPDDTGFDIEYIEDEHEITFPMLNGWSDDLEDALTEAYENLGWTKSEEHELDPWDSPRETQSLVFVKLKEGYNKDEDEDDEEDEEEY